MLTTNAYPDLAGRRAILVHCNPNLREIYTRQFEALGLIIYDVPTKDDVAELIRSSGPPDLFILDRVRPDFDIVDAVRDIRTKQDCAGVPALLLYSPGNAPTLDSTISEVTTLVKPVRLGELVRGLRRLFSGAEDERDTGPDTKGAKTPTWSILQDLDHGINGVEILLAEDNVVNRRVISLLLEKMGFTCDHAENGQEALDALSRKHYDVVLMDVQMPVMDGLEATRRIRELPPGPQPFIVAVTANATEEDRVACIDAGMDRYLSKPVRSQDLSAILEEYITSAKK